MIDYDFSVFNNLIQFEIPRVYSMLSEHNDQEEVKKMKEDILNILHKLTQGNCNQQHDELINLS